jgi:tripartite-type tricarboxylate transporter receptor subunit TctC
VGGAGAGGGISGVPTFLHAILGMKFNIVEGYKSGEEVMLAMERNEVDGMCQTYQSVMLRRSEKFADGSFKLLFNVEERPIPGTSAPSLHSVVESEQQRRMLTFYSLRTELGRPIISPPGVPQERFSALRNAFDRVWKDPEFVAEANKRRLSLDSVSGAELDRLFQILVTSPPEIVERVSKVSRVRLKLKTRCC